MSGVRVNVKNFARVESDLMFDGVLATAGAVNTLLHYREPTPLDRQTIIRMNRDTLYSAAIVDISEGATLTVPDAGVRYVSVMVVNQDHYINRVYHDAGEYALTIEEFDTPYVLLAVRTLVDPAKPGDVEAVNALQDLFTIRATSSKPFAHSEYDSESYQATRSALLELARGLDGFGNAFGSRDQVDPVEHVIGAAAGWGGLPQSEAYYLNVDPGLPVGEYKVEVGDVPVDAFWSISLYNGDGYFEPNARNLNSVNSITADRNADGTVTVNFGTSNEDKPNYLPIMDGWNYLVRLYRPRPEILNGSWTFPSIAMV